MQPTAEASEASAGPAAQSATVRDSDGGNHDSDDDDSWLEESAIPPPPTEAVPPPPVVKDVLKRMPAPRGAGAEESKTGDGESDDEASGAAGRHAGEEGKEEPDDEDAAEVRGSFERTAREAEIVVGVVSPAAAAAQEAALEAARLRDAERSARDFARREASLARLEEQAKRRVDATQQQAASELRRRAREAREGREGEEEAVRREYRRAQAKLVTALEQ